MIDEILAEIRHALTESSDDQWQESARRYFKEEIRLYGVPNATVHRIARQYFKKFKGLTKAEIFAVGEELFKSDYSEEAYVAAEWAYAIRNQYQAEDFEIFKGWLFKYINSWAKCDTLCNHTIGSFVEQYPEYVEKLKGWARDENRWVRRGAAVTLVLPARKGMFLEDVFEIAEILLTDEDDLVRKGYGWMLKEASRQHQPEVFDFIVRHRKVMPRTALRYAIEKMPEDLRREAMKKE